MEVPTIGPHTLQKPPGDNHHHLASIHVDKHVKLGANMKRKEKKEYVTKRSRTFKEERDIICTVVKVMVSVFLLHKLNKTASTRFTFLHKNLNNSQISTSNPQLTMSNRMS